MTSADESARRTAMRHRLEIVEALVRAGERRTELMSIVESSADADAARRTVADAFGVSEICAHAILDLQLHRFAERERERLRDELDELGAALR